MTTKEQRIAMITGGNSGIGYATASKLAAKGFHKNCGRGLPPSGGRGSPPAPFND